MIETLIYLAVFSVWLICALVTLIPCLKEDSSTDKPPDCEEGGTLPPVGVNPACLSHHLDGGPTSGPHSDMLCPVVDRVQKER